MSRQFDWKWDADRQDYYTAGTTPGAGQVTIWAKDTLSSSNTTAAPKLCSTCVSIYGALQSSLIRPDPSGMPVKIAAGNSLQLKHNTAVTWECAFCKLLGDRVEAHTGTGFVLWLVNLLNAEERARAIHYERNKFVSGIYVWPRKLGSEGINDGTQAMQDPECEYRSDGLLMPAVKVLEFGVKVIDPLFFDFRTVKSWMNQCNSSHHECISKGKWKSMVGLKVIDCQKKCIVKHDMREQYLALSYVWGPLKKEDAAKKFPLACPRVILDAMSATEKMGYRYLWVDRYCINQQNAAEKQVQIAQMDLIYEEASLTIVAAAGKDDTYGLPGVGLKTDAQAMRKHQPKVQLGDLLLVSTLPDISSYMENCKWASRGWTYQEALLSRRCLIFTKDQVFFVCKEMCRSETLPSFPALRQEDVRDFSLQTLFQPDDGGKSSTRRLGKPATHPYDDDLRHHARMYATRSLSYDSDAINAFTGILKRARSRSYYGVPILASSSPKNPTIASLKHSGPSAEAIVTGFLFGLLWYVPDPEETSLRSQIPSWTWLSVKGCPIQFRYEELSHLPPLTNVSRVKLWVGEKNPLRPFSKWVEQHTSSMIPSNGPSLLLEGCAISITTMYQQSGSQFARFETGADPVIGHMSIDSDIFIPDSILADRWLTAESRRGHECDITKNGWLALLVLDLRGNLADGALEYLVLQGKGLCYKRIGIMSTRESIPGIRKVQLLVG